MAAAQPTSQGQFWSRSVCREAKMFFCGLAHGTAADGSVWNTGVCGESMRERKQLWKYFRSSLSCHLFQHLFCELCWAWEVVQFGSSFSVLSLMIFFKVIFRCCMSWKEWCVCFKSGSGLAGQLEKYSSLKMVLLQLSLCLLLCTGLRAP